MAAIPIYLEMGKKKVFALALGWPGWARAGKSEEDAIEQLASYAERYAPVAAAAGMKWSPSDDFRVVERLPGTMSTDFGAPGEVPAADRAPVPAAARKRLASLVEATWTVFDGIVAVTPETLRKGARGGGRDRDKMVDHVLAAETSYVRKIGVKHKVPQRGDKDAIAALRADTLRAIIDPPDGLAWPIPYLARRLAWHVLDHAWEMQDKAQP